MENLVAAIASTSLDYSNPWLVAVSINTVLLGLALVLPRKLLTTAGIWNGWLLGVLVWGTLGWQGYAVVLFYFLVGSLVTKIGMAQKEAAGIAENRSGARGPENVWGSALTGTICAVGTLLIPWVYSSNSNAILPWLLLGYVASFCTKLSDTCGSEVGKAYGKSTFLITTLQPVARGTEGAISLEGTLAGIVGSLGIALVGWSVGLIDLWGIVWCVIAALIGTNLESVIGATLQNKYDWLTNEVVNFINTLIGAIAAISLAIITQLIS
ncbi:TIGR00297 family protein [Merismopedia glauca]|uniref:TIGR00297 family protein n=1 Tax=Merismopedia glauca CCAP 1448/3 TaxID=1296344 RepID=A0A2T1C835_9CYAN|nr:TIGR00297 family protein [Merismopedia glauca]PSB04420.1 TIGR00297 family protein [Merismopedia glauca CCAP 1448/3]